MAKGGKRAAGVSNAPHGSRSRYKFGCRCKRCFTAERDYNRFWQIQKRYGITREQYEALLEKQGGVCAICEREHKDLGAKDFSVDHCHKTGRVRGLLCHQCNSAIGFLQENPIIFARAVRYLAAVDD